VQLRYVRQKVFQLLEEAGQAGVLLQEDMVLARQCNEPGTRYSRRQFAAQFAQNSGVVANMHHERRRLYLGQEFA